MGDDAEVEELGEEDEEVGGFFAEGVVLWRLVVCGRRGRGCGCGSALGGGEVLLVGRNNILDEVSSCNVIND